MNSSSTSPAVLRLGTRASALALWQAEWVAARLRERGHDVKLVEISTRGDRSTAQPIAAVGGDGLFTKELQRALLDDAIDVAVHSLKDLPTEPMLELCLAAVPARGPVGDVLITRAGVSLTDLPLEATVGTGSLRRRAQLLHLRRDLQMKDIRGNVDTRLRKLVDSEFDAIVLARAGLARLGMTAEGAVDLPMSTMLPAVGQGALGVECRASDARTRAATAALDDASSHACVVAERAMLRALAGGCLAPIAGYCHVDDMGCLHLAGRVLSADGTACLDAESVAELSDADVANASTGSRAQGDSTAAQLTVAEMLGQAVALDLLARGAAALIDSSRAK